ncbi:hypothetical protein ACIPX0_50065 [Streptomyces sp. NPDC090075]|uniref:hypothetical protein n=1 Tax=Streptomyces sp. NPDC090075 TaxID=3365937 RepID=UPI0037F93C48
MLAQLLGKNIQFAPASGDPLPLLHPPHPPAFSRCADLLTDRSRGPVVGAAEPGIPPEPDCDFTMHTAQWRTGQSVRSDAYTLDQFISLAENASALDERAKGRPNAWGSHPQLATAARTPGRLMAAREGLADSAEVPYTIN